MMSLGSSLSETARFWLMTVGVGILLAGILGYLLFARGLSKSTIAAFSLILGGGMSNLFDRVTHSGMVIDFMSIGFDVLRTGVFNFADVAITSGVGLYVLHSFRREREGLH
jgi:signal peptidase II